MLHVASSKEMFSFIWEILDEETREALVMQKNKAGETPFMAHIMYGHEDIFLDYFPRTHLYQQLQRVSSLTSTSGHTGIDPYIAKIRKDEVLTPCTMGDQNMWQRAQALYQDTKTDAYAAPYRNKMKQVRDMIGQVAPFMIVG